MLGGNLLLVLFGLAILLSLIFCIQMLLNTGETCFRCFIKRFNLMEFGLTWMNIQVFAVVLAQRLKLLKFLIMPMIYLIILAFITYKMELFRSIAHITTESKRPIFTTLTGICRLKQHINFWKVKIWDRLLFLGAQPWDRVCMETIGLEIMQPLGSFYKVQYQTYLTAILMDLKLWERIFVGLVETLHNSFVLVGTSWEVFILFQEVTMLTDLNLNSLML